MFKEVQFVKSVFKVSELPVPSLPEVAFLGRSNVGKSSLINAFLRRKKAARVSSTPGFTKALNFFRIDHRFFVVDLPGYGFAKVPPEVQRNWKRLVEGYLTAARPIKLLVLIFDIRRKPDHLDHSLVEFVQSIRRNFIIVLNKIDKVSKRELSQQKALWLKELSVPEEAVFLTSCRTQEGIEKVRAKILKELGL